MSYFLRGKQSMVEKWSPFVHQRNGDSGCKASIAETFLLSQFIRGISDNAIRTKLLESGKIEFQENVDLALAQEACQIDSREISNPCQENSSSEVCKIISNRDSRHRSSQRNKPDRSSSRKHSRSRGRINYQSLGLAGLCLHCSRNNHETRDCNIDAIVTIFFVISVKKRDTSQKYVFRQ